MLSALLVLCYRKFLFLLLLWDSGQAGTRMELLERPRNPTTSCRRATPLNKCVFERHVCLTHFCVSQSPDGQSPVLSAPRRLATPLTVGSVTHVLPKRARYQGKQGIMSRSHTRPHHPRPIPHWDAWASRIHEAGLGNGPSTL